MSEDNSCLVSLIPVPLNDTLKSFGKQSLLMTSYTRSSLSDTETWPTLKQFPIDDYAKDGGPGEVRLLCSFYHESLCT